MTLERMTAQLKAAYGRGLRAVVLYGSAARDGAAGDAPPRGGYDLLVVVEALGMDELRRVAPTTRAWIEAGNRAPLTLTALEWRASADVFPMEYADVLDAHRVLAGALPLEGIAVDRRDLRRQLEHQTLGALLQLRAGVLASGNDANRLLALLEASRSTILVLFRTLARLHGAPASADPTALAEWAGTAAGFDAAPFVRVIAHAAAGTTARAVRLAAPDAGTVLTGYLVGLERLLAHVDAAGIGPAS
ncbi:hypothetical protein tb265_33140 [Gemmatimonadetes bacterium T265]|nr:hypothetical protein tb265_33140 [Gemmatimonadetes bacterium T265]